MSDTSIELGADDASRARDLRSMKARATGLFVVVTVAFIVTRALEGDGDWLSYVRATCEAAMVGALADWFAVTALFRHPLGLPIPHTAIIPKRKDALGQSLEEFVTGNFLTDANARERVVHADVVRRIGHWLTVEQHSAQTIATDPDARWLVLADNRNTHHSETLVRLVASHCALAADLGVKGVSGILHAMATRAAFLSDPAQRIQFLSTPKHTSWRNQIKRWCSILVRRVRKRGNFASLDALRDRILAFIASCNQTAHPFRWTATGRALCL